ncbi:MAG TPA: hypothetical protein VGC42_04820, partial [Kofleriaceae bacterium]
SLAAFPDLAAFAAFLQDHGFRLDDTAGCGGHGGPGGPGGPGGSGGMIHGSPAAGLEQLATRASLALVEFSDTAARVPGCRYNATRRHPLASGERFGGLWPAGNEAVNTPVAAAGNPHEISPVALS